MLFINSNLYASLLIWVHVELSNQLLHTVFRHLLPSSDLHEEGKEMPKR